MDLFNSLADLASKTVPAILQPGVRIIVPGTGGKQTIPAPNTVPIQFDVCQITSNQLVQADRILDGAVPPPLHEEVERQGSFGMVKVQTGYDHDNPEYLAKLNELRPRRNAMLCLFGCPDLRKSTPGDTLDKQIDALMEKAPAFALTWLAAELEEFSFLAGVGEDKVSAFFPEGSAASRDSESSSERSPQTESEQP